MQQDFTKLSNYAYLSTLLGGFRLQFLKTGTEIVSVLAQIQGNLALEDVELLTDMLLKYLFRTKDDLEPEQLAEEAEKLHLETLRSKFMSIAQRLIDKGVNIGFDKGVNVGFDKGVNVGFGKGVHERDRALVHKLFADGHGLEAIAQLLGLEQERVQHYLMEEGSSKFDG